jgi:flagellar assembly protein FliH
VPVTQTTGVSRYEFPEIVGHVLGSGISRIPTAEQIAALHEQAYAEGYESGTAEGYAAGQQQASVELTERLECLDGLMSYLAAPLAELEDELVETVAELALLIARHLVRRELRTEPGEVIGVVRETMRHLPLASSSTVLRLNPDDLELVRSALALGDADTSQVWRMEADPLMTRGGCIVESASSRIDASVETRLAAIASQMFGGERGSDHL